MRTGYLSASTVCLALSFGVANIVHAQTAAPPGRGPERTVEKKIGITGAFEGWFPNPDGTFSLLLGYYNRNLKQTIEIPIGPNNRIEPGGPDQGQPTHFLPARQWGVFTITVPKDFGEKKLTWTLVANGKTTVIPVSLHPQYEVQPFLEASGNTPPFIGFSAEGPFVQGPRGQSRDLVATVSDPLTLAIWVADDAKSTLAVRMPGLPVTVGWSKFR